jgi:hypothetical protein
VVIRTASARDPAAPQHDRAVRLLPLLAGLGSLVAFALVVGRYEHRFVLPLGFWLSIYAAVAIETIRRDWFAGSRIARRGLDLCGGALVGAGLVASIALVLTQWGDARRAVEDRLRRLPPGTSVETYGPLVYLPRFETATMQARAAPYHIRHVATGAVASRNPLAGMDEVQGDPATSRAGALMSCSSPRASRCPTWPRLRPAAGRSRRSGSASAPNGRRRRPLATLAFVRAAVTDTLPGYRLCAVVEPRLPLGGGLLAPRRIHASTGGRDWLLVRADRLSTIGDLGRDCGRADSSGAPSVANSDGALRLSEASRSPRL